MASWPAGTHADSRGFGRVLGLITTVAGMLIFALMIGVVSDTIGARVDDLKRGSAKVRAWYDDYRTIAGFRP